MCAGQGASAPGGRPAECRAEEPGPWEPTRSDSQPQHGGVGEAERPRVSGVQPFTSEGVCENPRVLDTALLQVGLCGPVHSRNRSDSWTPQRPPRKWVNIGSVWGDPKQNRNKPQRWWKQ